MTRPPIDRQALADACILAGAPVVAGDQIETLAAVLDQRLAEYVGSVADRDHLQDSAKAYAETIAKQLADLDVTIRRRRQALAPQPTADGVRVVGTAPPNLFALASFLWLRTLATWQRLATAELQRWQREAKRPPDEAWLSLVEDVMLALAEAGVTITTSDTGVFVKVLRDVISPACGRTADVRGAARKVRAATREVGGAETTTNNL